MWWFEGWETQDDRREEIFAPKVGREEGSAGGD